MENGVESCRSRFGFDQTVEHLTASIEQRGLTLFCAIDHAGAAAAAGLSMPATRVLIFGTAAAGTPLMLASPSLALDLPLRLLIAERPEGVLVSWSEAAWLSRRHGLDPEMSLQLGGAGTVARSVAV